MEQNCIFCKIIKGEISTEKILETENFIVIKDINPKTQGHSLVIPKNHYETFLDLPQNLYQEFLETTNQITKKLLKETNSEGFNIIMNNKQIAGQIIPHLHLHILPRKKDDGFSFGVF